MIAEISTEHYIEDGIKLNSKDKVVIYNSIYESYFKLISQYSSAQGVEDTREHVRKYYKCKTTKLDMFESEFENLRMDAEEKLYDISNNFIFAQEVQEQEADK